MRQPPQQTQTPPSQPRRGGRLPNIPRPRLRRGDSGPPSLIDPVLKKVRSYNPKADLKEIQRIGEDLLTRPPPAARDACGGEPREERHHDLGHVDVAPLQFLPQDERQEEVERPFEGVEIQLELAHDPGGQPSGGLG